MHKVHGVITPLITPFNDKLEIDIEALEWLVKYQVKHNVHGVFPNSSTGEFVHLSFNERIRVVERVVDVVDGKCLVLPGISSNYTDESIALGLKFIDIGVDGVIVTTPYYFKLDYDRLKHHFSRIADKLDTKILLYDNPSCTGIDIPLKLYVELVNEYSNIVGVKITHDNFSYTRRVIECVKSVRKDFSVLIGKDDYILPGLMIGCDGFIASLSNVIPRIHVELYNSWCKGDFKKAYSLYRKVLAMVRILDIINSPTLATKLILYILNTPVKPYARPPLVIDVNKYRGAIEDIIRTLNISVD